MKTITNFTMPDLVNELRTRESQKHDFIQIGEKCRMRIENGKPIMTFANDFAIPPMDGITPVYSSYSIADDAHANLSAKLSIHRDYYNRMLTKKPDLLATNINSWLDEPTDSEGGKTMFLWRTYRAPEGSILRAVLSRQYAIIDNLNVLIAGLEGISRSGAQVEITRCQLSDRSMYVDFQCPNVMTRAPEILARYTTPGGHQIVHANENDGIMAGFTLRNSETGFSQFEVIPRFIVAVCNNGLVQMNDAYGYRHLGKKNDVGEITPSHRTMNLKSELAVSQVSDAITMFTQPEYLEKQIARLVSKGAEELSHPTDAVKNAVQEFNYSDERANRVIEAFMRGSSTNRFALTQAFTFAAHSEADPDTRFDMERDGIKALETADHLDHKFTAQKKTRREQKQISLN